MSLPLPVPTYRARSVYSLTPRFLRSAGIRLLLLDLDNTLIPYGGGTPGEELRGWAAEFLESGLELFIISNNRRGHAAKFARDLGVGCIDHAGKPSPEAVFSILRERGIEGRECALVGDQVYTDVFCAARAGIISVLVEPVELSNLFRRIRRALELPFRSRCKKHVEDF